MSGILVSGFFTLFMVALNFAISWWNAKSVGKIWSESKQIGGFTRVLAVSGYVMAIAGFTMVYSIVLIFLVSVIGPMTGYLSEADARQLVQIISDLSYVLIAFAIIPSGIIITINSMINFWKKKSLKNGGIAGWNTFASVRNVVSASRNIPSAISRLSGTMKNSKGNGAIIVVAVIVVLCAILGGYFTASAIMKRADKKYDLYSETKTNLQYNASMAQPQTQQQYQQQPYQQQQQQQQYQNQQYQNQRPPNKNY